MIRDIVVNLPVGKSADVAASFAVSLAAKFGAHLTGIAFRYEPVIPAMVDMYGVSPEIIESQREENEKTALQPQRFCQHQREIISDGW
jgi:hypothetical protein